MSTGPVRVTSPGINPLLLLMSIPQESNTTVLVIENSIALLLLGLGEVPNTH